MVISTVGLVLTSCAKVQITDSEWCGSLGPHGAHCFHTLSTPTRDIDVETFFTELYANNQFCTPATTFADWKMDIEKLCAISKRCTVEQIAQLRMLTDRMEEAQRRWTVLKAAQGK